MQHSNLPCQHLCTCELYWHMLLCTNLTNYQVAISLNLMRWRIWWRTLCTALSLDGFMICYDCTFQLFKFWDTQFWPQCVVWRCFEWFLVNLHGELEMPTLKPLASKAHGVSKSCTILDLNFRLVLRVSTTLTSSSRVGFRSSTNKTWIFVTFAYIIQLGNAFMHWNPLLLGFENHENYFMF